MRLTRRALAVGLATVVAGVAVAVVVARLRQPSVPLFDSLGPGAIGRPAAVP